MSVHSHSAAPHAETATPEFPRHVVTAVLVAHDGGRWLPDVLAALTGQERPVQNVVAADTGSADESARLLAETLGDDRVLHLARRTGFGTAVEEAVRGAAVLTPEELPYLKRPSGWDPVSRTWRDDAYDLPELPHGEPVQWLWLLHDDSAPAVDALTELLRVADQNPDAAIIGPKLRGWYDRKQLLEAGVSIARSGRRWTGLDRREQDQGQHDQVRPVLAVSSAGMLIRREVFEALGGFDRRLPLMRDDVDLCWRAHAAGHRVLIAPDAVLRHAEAAARERRPIDCVGRGSRTPTDPNRSSGGFGRRAASPHRVDKAGAVYTVLVNARAAALPYALLRIVLGTLLRTLAYLVMKAPGQAVDEARGLVATLLRPGRILAARRRRGRPSTPAAELRPLFPPPGATVRAAIEQIAGYLGARSDNDTPGAGRHGAVETGPGGDEVEFLEVEQFARVKRIARKPAPVLFALLLLVSLVASRALLAGGSLAGGALLPAPGSASTLWSSYLGHWHPVGTGSTESAPPYLAVIAGLATLLFGSTEVALTLLLVCSVPLAGLSAYFASRPLVTSKLLRAWAAVAYAFLPAATGALAQGRIGTAVLAVLLPLLARSGVAAFGFDATRPASGGVAPNEGLGSWRAVWTFTLLLTVATAFTPVLWPLSAALGLTALLLRRRELTSYGPRYLAVLATPLVVLAPWSLTLFTDPAQLLREAGLPYPTDPAGALDLIGISPGGPQAAGGVLLIGIVLAALAALLRGQRQFAIRTAWAVAVAGLLCAVLVNRTGWAGPATLVYGIALLAAAVLGADGARERVAAQNFGWRQPLAALIAFAAAAGPLLAAAGWMLSGADGPIKRRDPVQVPAFVAEESGTRDQARTLVLGGRFAAEVSYALVRGSGARLGDAELAAAAGDDARLDKVVSNLVAGSGADQTSQLGSFAIRYVLVRDGAPQQMRRVLDATPGLSRLSQLEGSALWRVDRQVSRVVIVSGREGDDPIPVASRAVGAETEVPAGPAGRTLRIADTAAAGWRATLDGQPLKKKTVDGWAQGFALPAEGGKLVLGYDAPLSHTAWNWTQGALALLLLVLALPGRRTQLDDDLPDEPVAVPQQAADGEGRRARRLRAEAQAAQGPDASQDGPTPDYTTQADPYATAVPHQANYGEWESPAYATEAHPTQDGYGYGYDGAQGGYQGAGPTYGAADASPYGEQSDPARSFGNGPGGYSDPYTAQGHPLSEPDSAGTQPYQDGTVHPGDAHGTYQTNGTHHGGGHPESGGGTVDEDAAFDPFGHGSPPYPPGQYDRHGQQDQRSDGSNQQ
ncbi:glycosyltransferase family 2 protein [Streptomyces sp. NPDC006879]|uniref:glycosyltransferase family 2 protein n=1 Tax=Streptomyces sp. NPDC006879 TaxID=3364767 RepID=UPI0036C2F1F5